MKASILRAAGAAEIGDAGSESMAEDGGRERLLIGAIAVGVFLAGWELVARTGMVHPLFISSPMAIAAAAKRLWSSGDLTRHVVTSGIEFIAGCFLAAAVGVPVGLAAGWYRRLNYVLDPFLAAFYATPRIALLPLIVLWMGFGFWSKAAIVFLSALFPICMTTIAGVRTVSGVHVELAQSFAAREAHIFRTIVIPSSLPFILTGLRLGVGRGLVGVVVAELYGASAGIGFLINVAGATFQTDTVFVGIALLACLGLVLNELLRRAERRVERWRPPVGAVS
jgi:ABC-type nitrate/sulfonate/bicarbonate transport system permease component